MFSGIIQAYGKISKFSKSKDFLSIEIQSNLKGIQYWLFNFVALVFA